MAMLLRRCCQAAAAPRAAARPKPLTRHHRVTLAHSGISFGAGERVVDVEQLLAQVDDDAVLLSDDDDDLPVWEHETRFQGGLERPQQNTDPVNTPRPKTAAPSTAPTEAPELPSAYSPEGGFHTISAAQVAAGLADVVLDVRTDAQLATGPALPRGALHLPLELLTDAVRAGTLDAYLTARVAVACADGGQRSAQAVVRLSRVFGFKSVSKVEGGAAAIAAAAATQQLQPGRGGCGCGGGGGGSSGGGCGDSGGGKSSR